MKKTIKASLIASAIAMLPLGGHAAGLGAINVFSGLGQPLRAEIELAATVEELKSLTAVVASPEAFRRANLQYSPAMASLRLAVEQRGSRAVVKLTSDRPLNEPFVDVLLELSWASGSLLREYTFLLDPVPVVPPVPAPPAARPAVAPPPARAAQPAVTPSRPAAVAGSHAVRRGDTLRRVAEASRPADVTLDQMLIALFRENPEAFDGGNMNRLRAGSVLTLPDADTVRAVDPAAARQEIQAQAADFNAYRAKLAGAVAARPVAETPPTRGDAGAIVPKVTEPAARSTGDRVKVSGGRDDEAGGRGEDPRLARLQALEEELAARDKALEEANSRLGALEESLRQMQQLLELRSGNMAQLQQQAASGVPAPAPAPAAAPPTTQAAAPAAAPVESTPAVPKPEPAEPPASKPADQAAPKPAPKAPAPVPAEPSLLQTLLNDPMMLAGGGGILALLLAYAGLKVRQRRQQAGQGAGAASQFPVEPNSVFGKTGGQSVNTGESSVLHTDFSQSGLSAIDTDEGVDPVAEADVYMAYGRDAQAEEILLDALKTDSSRLAIYLKLLEIYAQRNNLKAFEATATDLYSRTGGDGGDWAKAAEMGRRLDPDNPLYQAKAGDARMAAATGGALGAAAVVAGATVAHEMPDEAPLAVPTLPEDVGSEDVPELHVELEALPQVDDGALDFDLDAGLGLSGEGNAGAVAGHEAAMPSFSSDELAVSDAMEIDLDLGGAPEDTVPPTVEVPSAQMNETVIGEGLEFAAADQGLEFDLSSDSPAPAEAPEAGEFNLDATMLGADEVAGTDVAAESDLEKTSFDSSLLDFDFNLGDAAEPSPAPEPPMAPEPPAIPPLDLSGIDLELDSAAVAGDAPEFPSDVSPAAEAEGGPVPSPELLEEVNTKLELARAYEEMGDSDGARELLDEVMREGSAEQREAASKLLERLG